VAASTSTDLPQPAESQPLEITGIDTKSALRRTGGNRKRYESLLGKFAQSSAGGVDEIRAALAAGDAPTAARAAHSLKGAAANLGATSLAEVAAKAESALTTGNGIEEVLIALATSLQTTVAAIRSALPSDPMMSGTSGPSAAPATVKEPLAKLKNLLAHDDGEAADFILESRPLLSKVLTESEINTLAGFIGNFDFESALKSLAEISARLSLKLE
jgi:HPt (histidine-containing phosphotransfer) domain-containing protein